MLAASHADINLLFVLLILGCWVAAAFAFVRGVIAGGVALAVLGLVILIVTQS